MRMTRQRKAVLALFEEKKQPMSADMILKCFPINTMNLSTVYRILERLYDAGIILKSIIDHTAYYYINDKNHQHFVICIRCKNMKELDCHLEGMTSSIEKMTEFKILQHDLTFYGYCQNCQKELAT